VSAPDHLGAQFSSHKVSREEHAKAVVDAQNTDPEKYWTVSEPAEGSQSFAVRDHEGSTHGYYSLKAAGRGERELGGLVNTSGAKGVGNYVMNRTAGRPTRLDAFADQLHGYYSKHGFSETGRVKFADEYAPSHWRPEYGRSDVVFMHRP
jgi:hypothetical protein